MILTFSDYLLCTYDLACVRPSRIIVVAGTPCMKNRESILVHGARAPTNPETSPAMCKPGDVGVGGAAGIPLPRLTKDSRRGEPPQQRRCSAAWCCSAACDPRLLASPLVVVVAVDVKGPPPPTPVLLPLLLLGLMVLLGLVEKLEPKLTLRSEREVVELLEEVLDGERALAGRSSLNRAAS